MINYRIRLKKVRRAFIKAGVDSFLVTKPENIFYLTGFRGDDSFLFITEHDSYIITDSRYENELRVGTHGYKVFIRDKNVSLSTVIQSLLKKKRARTVGFEPANISHYQFKKLNKDLKVKKLKPCYRMIENIRMIKDASEIKLIKESVKVAEQSLKAVSNKYLSSKYKEKDVANFLEYTMKIKGAEQASFPLIVATGKRSAFPHAVSGNTYIKSNSVLLIDFGAKRRGYCSDLTRTFFLGKITARFKRLYSLVLEAQHRAIDSIRAGVRIGSVDKGTRDFFKKAKVDQYFTHALGHGIGLEVHESPSLLCTCTDRFEEDMIVTVEPGLYINNWGGIGLRIWYVLGLINVNYLPHIPL